MEGGISQSEEKLLEKACFFAEKAHGGQKRKSGEPYFNHVLETSKILAQRGELEKIFRCYG